MASVNKYFHWCFCLLIFLLFLQLVLFLFLRRTFHQAKQRLEENRVEVNFLCGDFKGERSWWPLNRISESFQCEGSHCPDSYWQNKNSSEEELHVLSVGKPRPNRYTEKGLEFGHFVNIKVAPSKKPVTLALVSQSLMQWNLQVSPGSSLKEVLVIGPEVVWLNGLPEGVKLSFFSKDQICSFPTAWEDIKNPDNQFRRLFQALHEYTGLEISSFQGREVGWEMGVPFEKFNESPRSLPDRKISSHEGLPIIKNGKEHGSGSWKSGIHWVRNKSRLQASKFHWLNKKQIKEISLPGKVRDALYENRSDKLFVIKKYRFGVWNQAQKEFSPLHSPLNFGALDWPRALAFNPQKNEIYIYNDERGGEIFSYNVTTGVWNLFSTGVGYSLASLYFDRRKKQLYGVRIRGNKIFSLAVLNEKGEVVGEKTFEKTLDFSKNRWQVRMTGQGEKFLLKVIRPSLPEGEIYRVEWDGKDKNKS